MTYLDMYRKVLYAKLTPHKVGMGVKGSIYKNEFTDMSKSTLKNHICSPHGVAAG